jgi:predicted DCC family thiol-disulfide oxidoreductase YuxK
MTTVVTLLTQPECALCEQAKQVLARVGADHRLRVEEIALDSPHGQQLAATAGVMFAAGILLDTQPYAFGRLSEKALRRDLRRRAHRTEPATAPEGK